MGTTARLGLRYPELADAPNVPQDMQELASDIDDAVIYGQGVFASRPVSSPGTPGVVARIYFATDTNTLYYDMGTGWVAIGPSVIADLAVITAKLADLAVTEPKLADDSVTGPKIAPGAVGPTEIADGSVGSAEAAAEIKPSQGASAATEALRAIGTAAGEALPGNHASVTDRRAPNIPVVTALPGSPTDGQECYLQPYSGTDPDVLWHMVYSAGQLRWVCVGGNHYQVFNGSAISISGSTNWSLGGTPTLSAAVPKTGFYEVHFRAIVDVTTDGHDVWIMPRSSEESPTALSGAALHSNQRLQTIGGMRIVPVTASLAIGLYHREPGTFGSGTWQHKMIQIRPRWLNA